MNREVQHVLGISGGKDSAALAIYMSKNYSDLDLKYYTCDTGKELKETYRLIERLNAVLGKDIELFKSKEVANSPIENPFDHFLATYGGYLPSPMSRWCTKKMKLDPFEQRIGNKPTISYVGIRGDEKREGYISKKSNIQSIFPFRKNIWSQDVIKNFLSSTNIDFIITFYKKKSFNCSDLILSKIQTPTSPFYSIHQKLETLLNFDVKLFNEAVFEYLKTTEYPVGKLDYFPLIENEDEIDIDDVFEILDNSGVGIPEYYLPIEFEVEINGKIEKGTYSRSRSGCFFCFFQQKIEWVWLLEQHPELFKKALSYEKKGYTWCEEPLHELQKPDRVKSIKMEYIQRAKIKSSVNQKLDWREEIIVAEGEGCASCFI